MTKKITSLNYITILFLVVWANILFFGIYFAIQIAFIGLDIFFNFGTLGIILYLPFLLIILLILSPLYLFLKRIYNKISDFNLFKNSSKLNLFFSFFVCYCVPFFISSILKNSLKDDKQNIDVSLIFSAAFILMLDFIYTILHKKFKKFKSKKL